jgi:hypothetical protein
MGHVTGHTTKSRRPALADAGDYSRNGMTTIGARCASCAGRRLAGTGRCDGPRPGRTGQRARRPAACRLRNRRELPAPSPKPLTIRRTADQAPTAIPRAAVQAARAAMPDQGTERVQATPICHTLGVAPEFASRMRRAIQNRRQRLLRTGRGFIGKMSGAGERAPLRLIPFCAQLRRMRQNCS